ncbi:MAG: hypothetical protein FWE74_08965 [Oscillospiraceae bacterium]|nr:hypothetical protein [Oscillospiraceae bacterium]
MKRKITALIIAAVMILSLGACAGTKHAMTISGEEIRAGEFIYMQISASQEAADMFMDLNPDVNIYAEGFSFFEQEIDGKIFSNWVNDRAIETLKEMAVVRQMFGGLGLEISADDELDARRSVDIIWANSDIRASAGLDFDTLGDFYEDIGVGKESLVSIILNSMMEEQLFTGLYGENGTEEVSRDEIVSYFEENFVRYRVLEISLSDLEWYEVIELEDMALDFASRLSAGESFITLVYEYEDYLTERDHAHDEFNETYDEEQLPGDEEFTGDGEFISDEFIIDGHPDNDWLFAAESEEITDEITDETPEEIMELDIDFDREFDRLEKIGEPSFLTESEQEFLLAMPMNTAAVYADEEYILVLHLLPVLEREDWIELHLDALLVDMKSDEMQEKIKAGMNALDVVLNEAAIRRYKPETAAKRLLQPWL